MIEAANKTLISKTTGISLFLMAVAAGIGYGRAFGGFYVADNPAATVGNLAQAPFALYAAVISFTVVLILGIIVSLTLYVFIDMQTESRPCGLRDCDWRIPLFWLLRCTVWLRRPMFWMC